MKASNQGLSWSKGFMYTIHQTYFLAQKRLEQKLSHANTLSFSQFLIMMGLHCKDNASQSVVADFLYITEATVSRHISTLEKEKYLTRNEDPENRRKHVLIMTLKGQKEFETAHAIIEAELKEIFDDVEIKDRELITEIFERIISKLSQK